MKQIIFKTTLCVSAFFSLNSKAQNITDSTVTITANKISQKQNAKIVQVITQQQIKMYASTSVSQLLNNAAGFYVAGANSAAGSVQSVFNRGANASNTLILLNGVPMQDASGITQQFDVNQIAVDNIERIEICKQAQSSLYGSDAVAGVVNIITKKGESKPFNVGVNLNGGSFNSFNGGINISGKTDNVNYFVGYQKNFSDGISSAFDSTGIKNFDKDVFKKDNLQATLTVAESNFATITFNGLFSQYKAGLDNGAFKDEKDYNLNNQTANAGLNASFFLNKKNTLHAILNGNYTERNFFNDNKDVVGFSTLERSNYVSKTNFKELYLNSILNDNFRFIAGIESRKFATSQSYYSESFFGPYETTLGDSATVKQTSYYLNAVVNYKKLGFDAGVRLVNHQLFGNNFTYSFNPYVQLNKVKVFASINSAFKAPSQYQLFATPYNNKNLKAETSLNTEIGVEIQTNNLKITASAFNRNIKNSIQFVRLDTTFNFDFKYLNFDKQVDNGIEINANYNLNKNFSFAANYTYVVGEVTTKLRRGVSNNNLYGKDSSFNNLYRRPTSMGNINLIYRSTIGFNAQLQAQLIGNRIEPVYNAAALPLAKYTLVNLTAGYTFSPKATLNLQVNNIFDAIYQESRGYGTLPRNILAGIKLNF